MAAKKKPAGNPLANYNTGPVRPGATGYIVPGYTQPPSLFPTSSPKAPGSGAGGPAGGRTDAPTGPLPGQPGQPGQVYVPGTPGVKTPPVAPFLTPDQQIQVANAVRDFQDAVYNLDQQLGQQTTETKFQQGQNDKNAAKQQVDATDSAIARGLFRSSVRDAELADVVASNAIRNQYLTDQLSIATASAEARKKNLKDALDKFTFAMNQHAVQNAADAGKDQPLWQTPPTEGHYETPKPPAQVATGTGPTSGKGGPAGGKPATVPTVTQPSLAGEAAARTTRWTGPRYSANGRPHYALGGWGS